MRTHIARQCRDPLDGGQSSPKPCRAKSRVAAASCMKCQAMFRFTPTALPVMPKNLPATLASFGLARTHWWLGRLSNPYPRFTNWQRGQPSPPGQSRDFSPQSI